ncbi:MAG: PAS domain-containing protein [Planctomycetota bacterium]
MMQTESGMTGRGFDWLKMELFEQAPLNIAVIDRSYQVVETNRNFATLFGDARGKKCFEIYKKCDQPCANCEAFRTFEDGKVRVNEETGVDRDGRVAHYMVHVAPVYDHEGNIPFVLEMSTDITETTRLKHEYQTLFEQVPCYVTVLNEDLRIVRANERFRKKFGGTSGQHCFQMFKRRKTECESCPTRQTFADGKTHTSEQVGISKEGELTHYIVTTAPASRGENGFTHVIEMAVDVTDLRRTEEQLVRADALREALVEHSHDGIIGSGPDGRTLLVNPAAREILGLAAEDVLGQPLPEHLLPAAFRDVIRAGGGETVLPETIISRDDGEEIPVGFSGHVLKRGEEFLGTAAFLKDLRELKQVEREKIDAERLAAVGQTVAGLAHGIKNILTGLEGGMYFLKSGLKGGKEERLDEGWGMLSRNMEKISVLVRNLLSFSKGRELSVEETDPARFVDEMVELYREAAGREGVVVTGEKAEGVAPAPFDREGIHTCLANLVSNAIDACQMSGRFPCEVAIRLEGDDEKIVFTVRDEGCGMDQEVRRLAFTNFFTTKGSGGTGLGLLLTRKIVQEHGGRITLETTPGEGSVFRLIFPRNRLPVPEAETTENPEE